MTNLRFTTLLLLSLVVAVLATSSTTLISALAPVQHDHRVAPSREKFCGGDFDCVLIKEHGKGGVIKIDEIDLFKDTVEVLIEKLPGWFGPRPARFVHALDHNVLVKGKPLAEQGVEIMHTLVIYEAKGEEPHHTAGMTAEEEARLMNLRVTAEEQEAELEAELDPFSY